MAIEVKKIPYMEWITVPPDAYCLQNVICTKVRRDGERYVEFSHVGKEYYMTAEKVIAYMIIPHINTDRSVWKSEYCGDDLPKESGRYICCMECKADRNEMLYIRDYWFDKRRGLFGGVEAIGYMNIPLPYAGKKILNYN